MPRRISAAARMNVLLEDMRAQNRAVLEAVAAMRTELVSTFNERFERVEVRLALLEDAVRQNSRDIRQNTEDIQKCREAIQKNSEDIQKNSEDIRKNSEDIQKNSEDIVALRAEIRQLRHDFDKREERARIDALEQRVGKLEAQLAR